MQAEIISQRLGAACSLADRKALAQLATELGFHEPEKTATNLCELAACLGSTDLVAATLQSALAAADTDGALNLLERLVGTVGCEALRPLLAEPLRRQQLLTILGGSPFLAGILCRDPQFLHQLFAEQEIDSRWGQAQMEAALTASLPEVPDYDDLLRVLRQFKQRAILRIGARDLCGLAPLEEITNDLSNLAAAALEVAVRVCRPLLDQAHGAPREDDGTPARFVVMGMGKFGARELNFSSDIDLIYFYSTSHGRTEGRLRADGSHGEGLSLHAYFVKLGEMVSKAIGLATGDGFVFRVDMRLRPEGNSGDLAISLQGAEDYYESWGRSWERAAMIKARPVAGDLDLGEELLQRLKPFVYRRYLDFAMVEDIKVMKQKIDASLTKELESDRNLKLGRGGIREIEFFIQALQLINGGKQPQLQERNSLVVLQQMGETALISAQEQATLAAALRFLRTVEHRIQIVHERQTHHLPQKPQELLQLARRSGFSTYESFRQQLDHHRDAVHQIYHDLFFTPGEELEREGSPELAILFDPAAAPQQIEDFFASRSFANPKAAAEILFYLRGQATNRLTERGQRVLDRLGPLLMAEVMRSAAPEKALLNLERFLQALHARSSFFALLAENRGVVRLLVELFSSSQLLSRIFIQHPEILDAMVAKSYTVQLKTREEMYQELATLLARDEDYGQKLETLRRYRNEQFLRIALNDLNGKMSLDDSSAQLSCLAEAVLEHAWQLARAELLPRYGLPRNDQGEESDFAIVGMGKLGGHELNYHSDLDIIFIYDGDGHTDHPHRSVPNQEYFPRLAQRIISALTLATREGYAYKIDTQLRPSGNQGPLVTSLKAFVTYHQENAQPWERQAMIKARTVVGPRVFRERLDQLIAELTYERPVPPNLAAEMVRLRGRMEREIARESSDRVNIKTGYGGMVDVEFIAQYLQLCHGGDAPVLRSANTQEALVRLKRQGLLPADQARQLADGYAFLRRTDNRLRLLHDQSVQDLGSDSPDVVTLARSLGIEASGDGAAPLFLQRYREVTRAIRDLFDLIINS